MAHIKKETLGFAWACQNLPEPKLGSNLFAQIQNQRSQEVAQVSPLGALCSKDP